MCTVCRILLCDILSRCVCGRFHRWCLSRVMCAGALEKYVRGDLPLCCETAVTPHLLCVYA